LLDGVSGRPAAGGAGDPGLGRGASKLMGTAGAIEFEFCKESSGNQKVLRVELLVEIADMAPRAPVPKRLKARMITDRFCLISY
jgi:hypothetical protein